MQHDFEGNFWITKASLILEYELPIPYSVTRAWSDFFFWGYSM